MFGNWIQIGFESKNPQAPHGGWLFGNCILVLNSIPNIMLLILKSNFYKTHLMCFIFWWVLGYLSIPIIKFVVGLLANPLIVFSRWVFVGFVVVGGGCGGFCWVCGDQWRMWSRVVAPCH